MMKEFSLKYLLAINDKKHKNAKITGFNKIIARINYLLCLKYLF